MKTFTVNCAYATDYVKDEPSENIELQDRVKQGFRLDIVVFFPRCFVSEKCPAPRHRGYTLCTDRPENRCSLTYRGIETEVCRLGEYCLAAKQIFNEENLDGKVLVIPGGRQATDILLVNGIPRAAVGIACPPDLKEGYKLMKSVGTRSFLLAITKLEFDLKGIPQTILQSCYENVIKVGFDGFKKALEKAASYAKDIKRMGLTPMNVILKQKN